MHGIQTNARSIGVTILRWLGAVLLFGVGIWLTLLWRGDLPKHPDNPTNVQMLGHVIRMGAEFVASAFCMAAGASLIPRRTSN